MRSNLSIEGTLQGLRPCAASHVYDEAHSEEEDRFLMLGLTNESRVLLVCHCERADGEIIRIISARKATKTERKHYKGGDQ